MSIAVSKATATTADFSDRTIRRISLEEPVKRWLSRPAVNEICLFIGEGGSGKVTLRNHIVKHHFEGVRDHHTALFDLREYQTVEDFLWRLRQQIRPRSLMAVRTIRDAPFIRFECCIEVLWEKQGRHDQINALAQSRLADKFNSFTENFTDVPIGSLVGGAGEFMEQILGPVKAAGHYGGKLINKYRKRRALELFPEYSQLNERSVEDIRKFLIRAFWQDIEAEQEKNPAFRACFLIDQYHAMDERNDRYQSGSTSDIVDEVFRHVCKCLVLVFSRRRPGWWSEYEKSAQGRSEGGFVGRVALVPVPEFSQDELHAYLHRSGIEKRWWDSISADGLLPELIAARVSLLQARLTAREPVSVSDLRLSASALHENLLTFWSQDEQVCLGILNRLGAFSMGDFREVIAALGLSVRLDAFDRLTASASVAADLESAGRWRMQSCFATAVANRLGKVAGAHESLEAEVGWICFHLLSTRVSNGSIDLAGARQLVKALAHLRPSSLDARRWPVVESVLRRILSAFEVAERLRDPELFTCAFLLTQVLYPLYKVARPQDGPCHVLAHHLLAWITRGVDHLSEAAMRHRNEIDLRSLEIGRTLTKAWCDVLDERRQADDLESNPLWVEMWIAKLRWNLMSKRSVGDGLDVARRILDEACNFQVIREANLPLAAHAAQFMARYAKLYKDLTEEERAFVHEQSMALYKRILDSTQDPATHLDFCRALLHPPKGFVVPVSDLKSVHRKLSSLTRWFGMTDEILALKVRAMIRLALHARDAERFDEAERQLADAEAFLRDELSARDGQARFHPARVLLRVFRKQRDILGRPFNRQEHGPALEMAAESVAELGPSAVKSLIGGNGVRLSEFDAVARQSDADFDFVIRTVLRVVAAQPNCANAGSMLAWACASLHAALKEERPRNEKRLRLLELADNVLMLDERGRSRLWSDTWPPLPIWNICARIRVENAWRSGVIRPPVRGGLISLYQSWLEPARRIGRSAVREILLDLIDHVSDPRPWGQYQLELWRLMRDVSVEFLPDDLSIHASILQFGCDVLRGLMTEAESASAHSSLKFLTRRLAEEPKIASLLTVAKRRLRDDHHTKREEGQRLVVEALAHADPTLPVDNPIRREARRVFLVTVWNAMWLQHARASDAETTRPPVIPRDILSRFEGGTHEAIADDLLRALAQLPLSSLDQGTRCVGILQSTPQISDGPEYRLLVGHKPVVIPATLASVALHHASDTSPEIEIEGRPIFINLLKPRDGRLVATSRGDEFVGSLLRLFYPGGNVVRFERGDRKPQLWMGASNSWAVVQMAPIEMSSFLANGGWMVQLMVRLAGLRRMTVVPAYMAHGPSKLQSEIRHFINNSWKDLDIEEVVGRSVVVRGSVAAMSDPRKLRTFESMFNKVFPDLSLLVLSKARVSLLTG